MCLGRILSIWNCIQQPIWLTRALWVLFRFCSLNVLLLYIELDATEVRGSLTGLFSFVYSKTIRLLHSGVYPIASAIVVPLEHL